MKKLFLFCAALICAVMLNAQEGLNYGVLVNGSTLFRAEYKGISEISHLPEYNAKVALSAEDQCVLVNLGNGDTWTVPLDGSSTNSISLSNGAYVASSAGCYDFWLKLSYGNDQLYVGTTTNCGEGEEYIPTPACTESFGLLIDGEYVEGTKNPSPLDPSFMEYQVLGVALTAGQHVQVYDTCNHAGWVITKYAETSYEFAVDNNQYVVAEDGTYDFYLKFKMGEDEIYVACTGCQDQPQPGSAVPSQCGDVLMQGFYYDSYEVSEDHAGTATYGDTKWKTLLAQAGEIGAYFDLIWLPPSAYASGTGYHPKQYSNQNSDWGSRADLEKLIAAFHNSGTKVVADIVINHVEAMSSWCDFAVQDFGEYGKFEPDGSYICSNDEMNNAANKKEAGECYGTATGSPDDGANWDAARDWSHDKVYVQDMFKAYLKWMKNVMHYDGWRYDKGDGFNNWHMDNYNKASEPYIAFMEYWSGNDEIIGGIEQANRNVMALDFQTKYSAFDGIASFDYSRCQGSGLLGRGYSKYAITFVDSHDWFLRDNGQEFGGDGNSMKPELKDRLMQANAFLLSMPGVPCVFYPHWAKYKEDLKPMINARHLAGVHSESAVSEEEAEQGGYKAKIQGKNGTLILCLGNKAGATYAGYQKVAYGNGYAIWVQATGDVAPGIIATASTTFEDAEAGIDVTVQAVGGSGSATIYYTIDGTDPTTASTVYTTPLNFKETTTLKVMAVCGTAQSNVQEYTYTYREPLQHGIRVRFNKPAAWDKVYIYAWIPGTDEQGEPTSENIMGAYPGQRIYQDTEGWFSYEFDNSLNTVNFCINSGDDCGGVNVRSNDLEIDYDACYGWREGKETESSEEVLLSCDTLLNPAFDLVISPESGFFRDKNEGQEVTISTVGADNAMIYYTLDGTEPTTASNPSQGSATFTVKNTTTVKAYAALDKERTSTYSATYTYKAPQQGAITVKFMKPEEWETLYLYAFTRKKVGSKFVDTPYPLDGNAANKKWPGMKWVTTEGGWYTYTMPADIHEIYVIFTEGDKKPQTQDIFLTENTCYLWNPDCKKAVVDANCDGVIDEGIEEIIDASKKENETYKLIIDGRLVIINRGVMYDAMGRRM
ncbi:MAG: chitobiase/beta-hexosaminidase C-terminal domain-containing protein [Paludibacteraceae bacterium]|nr:chitobiase/beta-hexosaminidase C-terminal domain-containing protein [Paludibacteraceae bacterium]